MFFLHRICRELDDDEHAPIDYQTVSSVNEGLRRRRARNMQRQEEEKPELRRSAVPTNGVPTINPRERPSAPISPANAYAAPRGLPTAGNGPTPAARVAMPVPDENSPFAWNTQLPRSSVPTHSLYAQAVPVRPEMTNMNVQTEEKDFQSVAPDAPREIPDWLRVAQQNGLSDEIRAARAPLKHNAPTLSHVEDAPLTTDILGRPRHAAAPQTRRRGNSSATINAYVDAGYPAELISQQRQAEAHSANLSRRMHHGMQYVDNAQRQHRDAYEANMSITDAPISDASSVNPHAAGFAAQERRPVREGASVSAGIMSNDSETIYSSGTELRSGLKATTDPFPDDPYAPPVNRGAAYAAVASQNTYMRKPPQAPSEQPDEAEPYRVLDDDGDTSIHIHIPWLGIGAFAAAILAVALWLARLSFAAQTEEILAVREQVYQATLDGHPLKYEELIEREAEKNGLNPAFVAAIVLNESSFNPHAESNVGARGLMQLMDNTAIDVYKSVNGSTNGYSFDALYTAETNVAYGCLYLRRLSERFRGDAVLVAAAYHAGPNEVQNWLNSSVYSSDNLTLKLADMIEGPTKQYVTRVTRDYAIYKRLYYQATEE